MEKKTPILVRAKFNAPNIIHKIIRREKVLAKLKQSAKHKLTLITAPAGFGKTTAAIGYLRATGLPFAWLSLDEGDNDPIRFWRYLLASLAGLGNLGANFWEVAVNRELITANLQADILLNKLETIPGQALIVLDDYHLIRNEVVQNSLIYFIKYLPSQIRMVILSRKELEAKFIRECASGQVIKVAVRELAFSRQEVAVFFEERGRHLTSEAVTAIWNYTEGWPAGLVVTAFSFEDVGAIRQTVTHRSSSKNRQLDRFLTSEIFNRWPDEVKDFLVRIAFMDKFCGPLCQTVTGYANSAELLKELAEGNSLIFHLDAENEWFRFHHLFRDFLSRRLLRETPAVRRQLYQRAGTWYRENGLPREAITAFTQAGEYGQTLPLLLELYFEMAYNAEFAAWLEMMAAIPPQYIEQEVLACTGYSWMLSMENRLGEANLWADRAQSCFERIKDGLTREKKDYLEAHLLGIKANLAVFEQDIEGAARYIRLASKFQLTKYVWVGEMNPGEVSLLKTVYGMLGQMKKAARLDESLVDTFPRVVGNFAAYWTVIAAECQYEWNKFQDAQRILTRGMATILELQSPGVIVPCMITLAKIKKAQGDLEGAIRTVNLGRQKLTGNSKPFWNHYFDLFTAAACLDRQDAAAAAEWLNIDRIGIFDNLSRSREYEYIIYARYLNLIGRPDEALLLLNRLEGFARENARLSSQVEILCLLALCHQEQGDSEHAMTALDTALELGMADGYVRTFVDQLVPMAELLSTYKNWKKKRGPDTRYSYAVNLLRLVQANLLQLKDKLPKFQDIPPQLTTTEQQLSVREYRVLRLLAAEHSNQEIADELCISVRTVKHHNSQIFAKLGVKNRREAVKLARKSGILE